MRKLTPHNKLFYSVVLSGFLASVGLIGGLGIQLARQDILNFLPLLIALPAMNAMAGEYAAITAAHLADPENYRKRTIKLLIALAVSLPISCLGVIGVSLGLAHLNNFEVTSGLVLDYSKYIFITLYLVTFLIFAFTYTAKRIIQSTSLNVEDTLIPISSAVASILILSGFAIMAKLYT